jgi:MtaA/CmuA family methyltransferase
MNSRELVLSFLQGKPVDRLPLMPITMMFAAQCAGSKYGRYALDHKVMADAQVRTVEEFGFDHVSAITETREAPDCGAVIQYFDDQPYAIDESHARLGDKAALASLKAPDPYTAPHMSDRLKGIALMKERLGKEKIVEGWVEGPCGAASDLRGINTLMVDFYDDPEFVRDLFEFVVDLGIRFGRAQVEAGADVLGIGDPAASLVGPQIYQEFVWPYEKKLVDGLHAAGAIVRLHICGNTKRILESMGKLGCDFIDIDSLVPLSEARAKMGPDAVLLGGLDPVRQLQNATPEGVAAAVAECHRQAGPRFIVAAGCEVPPGTPRENLLALRAYAHGHRP